MFNYKFKYRCHIVVKEEARWLHRVHFQQRDTRYRRADSPLLKIYAKVKREYTKERRYICVELLPIGGDTLAIVRDWSPAPIRVANAEETEIVFEWWPPPLICVHPPDHDGHQVALMKPSVLWEEVEVQEDQDEGADRLDSLYPMNIKRRTDKQSAHITKAVCLPEQLS